MTEQAQPFVVRMETITGRHPLTPYSKSICATWIADKKGMFAEQNILLIPPDIDRTSDAPRGRNVVIKGMLTDSRPWDAWLWIDDDHGWDPAVILSLCEAMRRGNVDIVSPLVSGRSAKKGYYPVVFDSYDEERGSWNIMLTGWEEPGLYPVAGLGTGFLMIKREVFEQMPPPWFERYPSQRKRDEWQGNDLYFCLKAGKLGFKMFLDSRVEIGHVEEVLRTVRKDFIGGGHQARMLRERQMRTEITPSKRPDTNTAQFWDGLWQNNGWIDLNANRNEMMRIIERYLPPGANVLWWGCGDGSMMENLKKRNPDLSIVGVDVSPVAISGCRRKNLEVSLLPNLNEVKPLTVPKAPFDVILVTDWMPRMVDPEKTLQSLKSLMATGAQFVCFAPNSVFGPEDVPQHHHLYSDQNMSQMLGRIGKLVEVDHFDEIFQENGKMDKVPMIVMRVAVRDVPKEVADAAVSVAE